MTAAGTVAATGRLTAAGADGFPARRPLTSSERRLVAMLDRTTREDLVAAAVLLAVTVYIGSPWLWLGWAARWLAPLGAQAARREILADRTRRGLFLLAAGHALAGVGTVAAVPQAAPLVMLVLFSDLTLAGYSERPARPSWFALCLGNIAAVALVSLGEWSDVPRVAPAWLFVTVLGGHGVATAAMCATTARETYTRLRDHGERLRVLAERARDADREGQLEVARALSSTTGRDLGRLADLVDGLRAETDLARLRAGAAQGSATAKQALAGLRALSHGVFPDVLHQHGLAAALRSLDHAGPGRTGVLVVEEPDERFPPEVESAFHALVATCLRGTAAASASAVLMRRRGYAELVLDLDGTSPDGPAFDDATLAALTDRVDGVRGTLEVTAGPGRVRVHAGAPVTPPPARPDADPQAVAILTRFISSSVVTSVVGLVTTSIVWAVTGSTAVALVDAELVVVLLACLGAGALERRGRHGAALGLLCFETAFAGIGTSLTIPVFAPTAALIVMLPLVLGLPYLTREALRVIAAAQSVIVVGVIVLGIWRTGIVDAAQLPDWVGLSLLAPTSVAVAVLVVIAISEGRAAVDASNETLQAALADLLAGIDATRRGIERDLHDGAQQHLAALAIQLHVVEQLAGQGDDARDRLAVVLDRVAQQTAQARAELALLVDGTFGATLRDVGVAEALRRSAALSRRPVAVHVEGGDDLPTAAAMTVYFVCNEAVQNATKHAGPDASVTITVRPDGAQRLAFRVEDDGHGCPPGVLLAGRGVADLVRRAREAGGELTAASAPGRGTTVHGWVPLTGGPGTGPQPATGIVEA